VPLPLEHLPPKQDNCHELETCTLKDSKMRSIFASLLALCLVGVVNALSSTGNRLLVILDDVADKDKYTQFWDDLQGQP